jgi:trehalose 6-phosphate synthase
MDNPASEQAVLAAIQDLTRQLSDLRRRGPQPPIAASVPSLVEGRLLVVANRLPVTLVRSTGDSYSFKMSSGGLVSALLGIRKQREFLWVGWIGEEVPEAERADVSRRLLAEHQCVPVFLSASLAASFYSAMSNDVLWPALHGDFHPGASTARWEYALWESYREATAIFADAVAAIAEAGDLIWLHDYHLMLLPALLRARLQKTKPPSSIAWFLHTPWPASSVFLSLPPAADIIKALLAADLVGFHTHDYARHFLSSAVRTLHGIETSPSSLTYKGRVTRLGVFPIGIEPDRFVETLRAAPAQEHLARLCARFAAGGTRVLVAVDRLDPIKGVPHRLLGLQALFRRRPEWVGRVVLVQVAVPSRVDVPAYAALKASVETLVGRINAEFGTLSYTPVLYLHRSVAPDELAALYSVADACLITSVRDGQNLVAFEYVACQHPSEPCTHRTSPGVLILSEFTGAAQSLAGALRVNPWSCADVADAIHAALSADDAERGIRHDKLHRYVTKHTAVAWAEAFTSAMVAGIPAASAGLGSSAGAAAHPFVPLPVDAVADRYADSECRIILVAYEDVLPRAAAAPTAPAAPAAPAAITSPPSSVGAGESPGASSPFADTDGGGRPYHLHHHRAPAASLLRALRVLAADPRNVVVLTSSAPLDFLEASFSTVPALRIVGEGGAVVRLPSLAEAGADERARLRAEFEAGIAAGGAAGAGGGAASEGGGSLDRAGGQALRRRAAAQAAAAAAYEGTPPSAAAAATTAAPPHRPSPLAPVHIAPGTPLAGPSRMPGPRTPVHSLRVRSLRLWGDGKVGGGEAGAPRVPAVAQGPLTPVSASSPRRLRAHTPMKRWGGGMVVARSAGWFGTVVDATGAPFRPCGLAINGPHPGLPAAAGGPPAAAAAAVEPQGAHRNGRTASFLPASVENLVAEEASSSSSAAAAAAAIEPLPPAPAIAQAGWKEAVRPIFRHYALTTPGSWVDEGPNSLVWRFAGADAELSLFQSKELLTHLESQTLTPVPLDIVVPPGSKSVEVRVRGASVTAGLLHVVDHHLGGGSSLPFDFVLVLTDATDECGLAAASLVLGGSSIVREGTQHVAPLAITADNASTYIARVVTGRGVASPPLPHHPGARAASLSGGVGPGMRMGETWQAVMRRVDYEVPGPSEVVAVLDRVGEWSRATFALPPLDPNLQPIPGTSAGVIAGSGQG